MVKRTKTALALAAVVCAVVASPVSAQQSIPVACDTDEAQSVIEARESARQRQAEGLQEAIDDSTGGVDPDIISDNCVADAFEGGIGASISLPSVGDVIGAIGDRAYDAFCGFVDDTVRGVDRRVEDATDPINDTPGVEGDAGVGGGNPNDESGVGVGDNDVTDDVADEAEDRVIDDAVDAAEDEVLDGLY